MTTLLNYLNSSIGRKQIVATTGLFLIIFLIGHLAGNLLIYFGPHIYNAYAKRLTDLRPGLYVIESGLLVVFLIHIYFTALLVWENIQARGQNYKMYRAVGQRSLATRLMPYTGTFILIFVVKHLFDFSFVDHTGPLALMPTGQNLGLYGIVYTSFMDPLNSLFYIMAMMCIGLHLAHGVQSFLQTFGFDRFSKVKYIKKISDWFALIITVGFSSIPIYVLIQNCPYLHK